MSATAESLSRVVVGNPIQFGNLSLFPLFGEGPAQSTPGPHDSATNPLARCLERGYDWRHIGSRVVEFLVRRSRSDVPVSPR